MATPCKQPSTIDAADADLVLKIRGGIRDGQQVRIQAPKCMIGSGPNCTLRLVARGVQPLHCLIVRSKTRAVVRGWAPDLRLNGRGVQDSPLACGDVLAVGPVEFEVVRCTAGQAGQEAKSSQSMEEPRPAGATRKPPTRLPARAAPTTNGKVQNQRLVLANQNARNRCRKLIARLRVAYRQLAEGRLREKQTETEKRRQTDARREDLERASDVLQRRSEQFDAWEKKLDLRQKELDARAHALKAQSSETIEPRAGRDPGGLEAGTASPRQEEPAAWKPGRVTPDPLASAVPQPEVGETSEEESIDAYMARLLARVKDSRVAARLAPPIPTEPKAELELPAPALPQSAGEPADITPRAVAAEKLVDLNAMRELANLSAQAAIDRHVRRTLFSQSTSKLILVLIALVSGALLMATWWFLDAGLLPLATAVFSFGASLFWSIQYAILTGRLIIRRASPPPQRPEQGPTPAPQG